MRHPRKSVRTPVLLALSAFALILVPSAASADASPVFVPSVAADLWEEATSSWNRWAVAWLAGFEPTDSLEAPPSRIHSGVTAGKGSGDSGPVGDSSQDSDGATTYSASPPGGGTGPDYDE